MAAQLGPIPRRGWVVTARSMLDKAGLASLRYHRGTVGAVPFETIWVA